MRSDLGHDLQGDKLPPLLFVHGSYHAAWCWQVRHDRVTDAASLQDQGHSPSHHLFLRVSQRTSWCWQTESNQPCQPIFLPCVECHAVHCALQYASQQKDERRCMHVLTGQIHAILSRCRVRCHRRQLEGPGAIRRRCRAEGWRYHQIPCR